MIKLIKFNSFFFSLPNLIVRFFVIRKVHQDTYHVTLLSVVVIVAVGVLNILFSIFDAYTNVSEFISVFGIRQHLVPGFGLYRSLRCCNIFQSINHILIRESKAELIFKIVALHHQPPGMFNFYCIKKVRQILINFNLF